RLIKARAQHRRDLVMMRVELPGERAMRLEVLDDGVDAPSLLDRLGQIDGLHAGTSLLGRLDRSQQALFRSRLDSLGELLPDNADARRLRRRDACEFRAAGHS